MSAARCCAAVAMGFNKEREAGMKAGNGKWQVAAAIAFTGILAAQGAQAEIKVKPYGQVDRVLLYLNDGNTSSNPQKDPAVEQSKKKLYFADNGVSATRFGLDVKGSIEGSTLVGGGIFELEFGSNNTKDISQVAETNAPVLKERLMDLYLQGDFGKLSLGQGDMASNKTSELDYSGTDVISQSTVGDIAGGFIFFDKTKKSLVSADAKPAKANADGSITAATDLKYNPRVKQVFDNFDGLSRNDRVRYDSPSLAGFTISASAAAQKQYDIALRYAGVFSGFKLGVAVAYGSFGDIGKVKNAAGVYGDAVTQVNGSVSMVAPFGLSLTAAAGQQQLDDPARKDDPVNYFVKLGYTAQLLFAGSTSFSVDYDAANDLAKDKDKGTSIGVSVVQRLDKYGTELFLGYRSFALDRVGANFADMTAAFAGARIKF
jgi:hypothetical protein